MAPAQWAGVWRATQQVARAITLGEHFPNYRFSDVTWTQCSNYSCISNGTMLAPAEAVPRMQSTVRRETRGLHRDGVQWEEKDQTDDMTQCDKSMASVSFRRLSKIIWPMLTTQKYVILSWCLIELFLAIRPRVYPQHRWGAGDPGISSIKIYSIQTFSLQILRPLS